MTAMATEEPSRSGWAFEEGDEIVPGVHAIRLLGGGERYEAYLSFDDARHYLVVAKVLRPDQVADRSALRGLRREAEILGSLSHPVIARLFGAEPEGERPHLLLEFVEGPRLSTLLRKFGALEVEQLAPLGIELASALHYLHEHQLVHLDVKPSNVIMASPPRLIDLSIARTIRRAATSDHPLGTDAYMAPEQCAPDPRNPMGPPSDVWGLGVTLHEAITGRRPFPVPEETRSDAPPFPQLEMPPDPLPTDVPASLAEIVMAALARRAEDRPPAREIAMRLEPLLGRPARLILKRLRPR